MFRNLHVGRTKKAESPSDCASLTESSDSRKNGTRLTHCQAPEAIGIDRSERKHGRVFADALEQLRRPRRRPPAQSFAQGELLTCESNGVENIQTKRGLLRRSDYNTSAFPFTKGQKPGVGKNLLGMLERVVLRHHDFPLDQ